MTLRLKTLLFIGVVLAAVVLTLYVVARALLLNDYVLLEEQNVRDNVQRAVNAVNDELASLNNSVWDYARWDDAYEYMQTLDETFVEENFLSDVFTGFRLNAVLFLNTGGEVVTSLGYDLSADAFVDVPAGLLDYVKAQPDRLRINDLNTSLQGFIVLPEGVMMVAARPITDSTAQADPRGTLLWGRLLNAGEVAVLAESTRLTLRLLDVSDPAALSTDDRAAYGTLRGQAAGSAFVRAPDDALISGFALQSDLNGDAALLVRVDAERKIYTQGVASLNTFLIALGTAGVVAVGATLLLVERLVLSRLVKLSDEVEHAETLAQRVSPQGDDELGQLSAAINRMLERQQTAVEALRSNEQQLSAIVTSAPIMVCMLDKSGTFIFAQGKGMETLGMRPGDLTGQTIFSDYRPLVEPFMKALGGTALRAEAVFNKVPVQMWLSPLRNQHDNVTGIIGVVTDITPA